MFWIELIQLQFEFILNVPQTDLLSRYTYSVHKSDVILAVIPAHIFGDGGC